jgi:uncharacterized protein YqeY
MSYTLFNDEINKAMKEGNKNRLSVLRMIKSDIMLEAKKSKTTEESIFVQTLVKKIKSLEKNKTEVELEANKKNIDASEFISLVEYEMSIVKEFLPRVIESETENIEIATLLVESIKDFKQIAQMLKNSPILKYKGETVLVNTSKIIPIVKQVLGK